MIALSNGGPSAGLPVTTSSSASVAPSASLNALKMPALSTADVIPGGKILALTGGANVIDAAVAVGSVVAVALLIIRLFRYAWDLAWKG